MRPLQRVLEIVLYVDDLEAAERFYGDLLGLELDSHKPGAFVFFRIGRNMLLLFDPSSAGQNTDIPPHGANGPGHVCFAVREDELAEWKTLLERRGITIEAEVAWPRGGHSFYFRDPAGNSLEMATPRIWGQPEDPAE